MLMPINTQQRQIIPSFESIDFRLTEHHISSRNLNNISFENDYEPESLTYTETQIGDRLSLKFLDLLEQNKQNHQFQIQLQNPCSQVHLPNPVFKHQQPEHLETIEKPNSNNNSINNNNMPRKKSILVVNTIELNYDETIDKSQDDTKRSNCVNFKRIQKKSSFSKTRPNSASLSVNSNPQSNHSNLQSNNSIPHSSKVYDSILHPNTNQTLIHSIQTGSDIKKRSISCMRTQDRSILETATRSCSKNRLQRSCSERASCNREAKKISIGSLLERQSQRSGSNRGSLQRMEMKENEMRVRKRELKRGFLEDGGCLQNLMSVKAIKLEENKEVSRAYLRKIIQNRVSIQHYAAEKSSRRMRQ